MSYKAPNAEAENLERELKLRREIERLQLENNALVEIRLSDLMLHIAVEKMSGETIEKLEHDLEESISVSTVKDHEVRLQAIEATLSSNKKEFDVVKGMVNYIYRQSDGDE